MKHNTEDDIRAVCGEIADMLIEKNRAYGDSALSPVRIFSKEASPVEQINVRMDDKLSRLLKGDAKAFGEDVEKDLMGYLVLKRVALRQQKIEAAIDGPPPVTKNLGCDGGKIVIDPEGDRHAFEPVISQGADGMMCRCGRAFAWPGHYASGPLKTVDLRA
jgi:hypothetical protein